MRVDSLHIYPIKGARGVALQRADVLAGGLRHDRRFMVVDEGGTFLTQREHPQMALVDVEVDGDRLLVTAGTATASIPLEPSRDEVDRPTRRVRVWKDEVDAIDVGGEGAAFFSDYLGRRCSLAFMPPEVIREVAAPYGKRGDHVGFADAYPILVASLASLAELNERLIAAGSAAVPMDRFRANVIVQGGEPYAEERGGAMRIASSKGSLVLRTPKRCTRCQVTMIDQATAEQGKEPLRMLATYRAENNKVNFAMNAIPELEPAASAVIAVGDEVSYG